jgi:LysM repeat protein
MRFMSAYKGAAMPMGYWKGSRQISLRHAAIIMAVLAILGMAALPRASAQNNLLQNPGFEGDYAPFNGDVQRVVAPGWTPWNIARKSGEPSWANITPQYLPSDQRVRGGQRAQEFYELYATFTGGVFQQVNVANGARVRFSAFVSVWSTELDDPSKSERPATLSIQVGIDPTGGTNPESAQVVWGAAQTFYDEYRELVVETSAAGQRVTAYVRAIINDPVRHNHVYVDDASLTASGGTGGGLPTNTPGAIQPTVVIPTREGTVVPRTPQPTVPGATRPPATPTPLTAPTRVFASPTPNINVPNLPGRVEYTVQPGDTVGGIAARFNSRVDAIIQLNGLRADGLIRVGQRLTIPVPQAPTAVPPTAAPPTATAIPVGGGAPVERATLNGPTVNGIGTYIMQPGDTLEAVARRYGISVQELARLNGIVNPNRLVIGQVLAVPGPGNNIPGGTSAPTIIPTQPGANNPPPASGRRHVVQAGENLFRISLRYNVTLDALMRANGISNPNVVFAGQVLVIP